MNIIYNMEPVEADILEVRKKVREFNLPYFDPLEKCSFVIKLVDSQQRMTGGITCAVFGNWLEIDFLWVDANERGKDLGTLLLDEAELIGREKGCRKASLSTFSFQARPFYEKHGYQVVYIQENYPKNTTKYYMEKDLPA